MQRTPISKRQREIIKSARLVGVPFRHIAQYLGVSRERVLQLSGEGIKPLRRKKILEESNKCTRCSKEPADYVMNTLEGSVYTPIVVCSECAKGIIRFKTTKAKKKQRELYDVLLIDTVRTIASNIERSRTEIRDKQDQTNLEQPTGSVQTDLAGVDRGVVQG